MKRTWLMMALLGMGLMAAPVRAEDRPGGPPPGGERGERGERGDRPDGPPRGERPDGPGRGERPDGGGDRPRPPEMAQVEMMRGYLDVVDRYTRMARDPSASGIAAVITASEVMKHKGAEAAIEFFNKMLPNVKNEPVQRAIRLQLIDLYKSSNQPDKAMEQLVMLMTSAPEGAPPAPAETARPARP